MPTGFLGTGVAALSGADERVAGSATVAAGDEVEPPPSKTTARSYAMSVGGLSANAAIAMSG